ncbi:glutamic acid-rich protein-like isoform X1 [Pomacea canaliculata]|uniref:glutamic acid-rich protein-like isoform X1 n=1 Tax=Pomacea canaliculata TaxID=400727 RepID=UPI000D73B02D|nr:glutamic acid-rich protein-like isoform X1 [Pomacea canaliculata]
MSQQGTILSTIICLLPLFSHLQPATGETTGELLESVAKQTQNGSYNEIVCTFNVNVSLSRVDFVHKTGTAVFAIVDCGISCIVLSSHQDVLRIVSPEKTISGDRFVFNATHSDRTTGTYTCHGVTAPHVVYTSPSGTGHGDGDGHGDGEESQMTSAASPQTDESSSHNDGGSSNGLLALIIIPILLVLGVVLFLHWWGVIQIPGLPKSRREPRDLRRIVGNRLQPVTGCWERTRGLWQPTREDNEDPLERLESNREEEEASQENKQLLGHNEDKLCLHHDKISFEDESNDGSKEEHPLLQDVCNNTKHTQDANASVGDSQTSPQSTLSPHSTDTKDEDSDVEDRQTLQSLHLSSSTKATDVAADLSSASLSRDNIQYKEESPHTNSHSSTPHDTGTSTSNPKPPIPHKPVDLLKKLSVNRHSPVKPRNAESENDDVNKINIIRNRDTPQTTSTRVETERGKQESMKGRSKPTPNTESMQETKEREGERARVEMKEEESSEAKSETINNEDMKGQLTTEQNKEDLGGQKKRDDDKEEVKMKEKETMERKSETESKEDARQKQERIEETMAAKVEQEEKEEAKREVEHAQEMKAEAMREQTADTRAETVQTSEEKKRGSNEDDRETAFDDDGVDRSRNGKDNVPELIRFYSNLSTGEAGS